MLPPEPFQLSGHNARVLNLFPSFCVTGKIHSRSDESQLTGQQLLEELDILSRAWEVGHWLESATFKDAVVDAMQAAMATHREELSGYDEHENVYAIAGEDSGLGRLLLDHVIWHLHVPALRGALDGDGLLGAGLARRLQELGDQVPAEGLSFGDLETCYYHEHKDEEQCYRSMFPR